jgi:hypothetical protein
MQINFSFRNVALAAVVAVAGYYGYQSFFGDIQTRDVGQFLQRHRLASSLKREAIRRRILDVYEPKKDYSTLVDALDHRSSVTQTLAVHVLTKKIERRVADKFLEMIQDPSRSPEVQEQLAEAFRIFPRKKAIPHLIQLTDESHPREVRSAAHKTLRELLHTGAQIKFGEATHQHWVEWWRDHGHGVKLR